MSQLEIVRRELVDLWGRLGPFWGVSRPAARVYGALLVNPEGLDADTLADKLELSRGAISGATRELIEWGIINADGLAGTRRILYTAEPDPEKVIRAIVRTRKHREWDPLLEHLRSWRGKLGSTRSREAIALEDRLAEIEGLIAVIDGVANALLEGRAVAKLGLKAVIKQARRNKGRRS